MSNAAPAGKTPTAPPRELQWLPGLLSFLVPGLGQLYQGRITKGVLFLACIYGLFFYGLWLGSGTVKAAEPEKTYTVPGSVYLPRSSSNNLPIKGLPLVNDLYNRPQYIGQFCAGVVAWPALYQYATYDPDYDPNNPQGHAAPLLGQFERQPVQERHGNEYYDVALNAVSTYGDKVMDLGWVYTVIAGVLNVLVIYDAIAGPAFLPRKPDPTRKATA